ncbi:hypothetical protein CYMTET_19803 [Cymbomonas tetramitiformis]|uniref:EF-hand domain-containing protein n=1 Tax=Cymbomonas tetramitiformis TaxID=36881 RepID=A0AAE0G5C7_9CHLO|nr:hypothetical protein CYMTET_19803 [Cymbomonas tetramitiformis]
MVQRLETSVSVGSPETRVNLFDFGTFSPATNSLSVSQSLRSSWPTGRQHGHSNLRNTRLSRYEETVERLPNLKGKPALDKSRGRAQTPSDEILARQARDLLPAEPTPASPSALKESRSAINPALHGKQWKSVGYGERSAPDRSGSSMSFSLCSPSSLISGRPASQCRSHDGSEMRCRHRPRTTPANRYRPKTDSEADNVLLTCSVSMEQRLFPDPQPVWERKERVKKRSSITLASPSCSVLLPTRAVPVSELGRSLSNSERNIAATDRERYKRAQVANSEYWRTAHEEQQKSWLNLRQLTYGFQFSDKQIRTLRKWFDTMDADGSGEISVVELEDPLISSGECGLSHFESPGLVHPFLMTW